MAAPARRLVLNGLTAEVRAPAARAARAARAAAAPADTDDREYYHELELYRQLLALPLPDPPDNTEDEAKRCDTPVDLERTDAECADATQNAEVETVDGADAVKSEYETPTTHIRRAKYLGSFPATWDGTDEVEARATRVSEQLHQIKESEQAEAEPVLVVVAVSGVKVCDEDQSVRMSHALRRISYATCESARALFAFVAREPRAAAVAAAAAQLPESKHFCHAFHTDTPQQAEELNSLVGDAFRMAFASQLQPSSAPHWVKELNGGGDCGMGVRAPDSLPGLKHHYPHCLSPQKCNIMGVSKLEASPTSSEESCSPEAGCYRRLGAGVGDRPPLMRRLALPLLLHPDDDDSTPLVADTPNTPTNLPLCLNGGYINEASDVEARTRESNREPPLQQPPASAPPAPPLPPAPRRHLTDNDMDEFRKCSNVSNKNCSPSGGCSRTTSSSSGGSSCGVMSHCSGNNNPRIEPELKQAPWFQQGIPREIALEVLSNQPVGSFLVRGSTTQPACYALSVRVPRDFQPNGIAHYLILRTTKGYKIKGFTKEFTSLSALVTHHSVMPELLPVPLRLARVPTRAREHADLDALAPRTMTPTHRNATGSHHTTPHHTPHHIANFLTQLDV